MDSTTTNDLCPCNSGLVLANCCGAQNRSALNAEIIARISDLSGIEREKLTPQLNAALDSIDTCPDLFPARINFFEDRAYFVKMSPRWYRESVFLDPARIRGTCVIESNLQCLKKFSETIPWQATPFIFHTAFCGSTLMTQVLDTTYNCLSLREPEILNNLLALSRSQATSSAEKDSWFNVVLKLLSRRYDQPQTSVIKANDYANGLMVELLKRQHKMPILFMYTPLHEFIAGCLKAENRRNWIHQRYQVVKGLAKHPFDLSPANSIDDNATSEMAAVYWSYNIALYHAAWRVAPDDIRSLDFNHLLENTADVTAACGRWFNLSLLSDAQPNAAVDGLFSVYSKNNNFRYSPQQRRDEIDRLMQSHADELASAESLARQLLTEAYPSHGLPGALCA